ncbi:MAG: hypothetical protein ACAI25_18230 [Planctomycetota bacterium]
MAMKECFGHGMQWWVPVKQGITNAEKQRECYECEDFEMCSKAHLVHSYRHMTEIILHHVQSTKKSDKPAGAEKKPAPNAAK